jgi:asparagine synthase (glutamine-hydrolysing)
MCGIVGLIRLNNQSATSLSNIDSAVESLHHRGPDYQNSWSNSKVALGHARLSIIDLDPRSNQPMQDISGRYNIVFNGEIYNFKELRTECENDGYTFQTQGDTEVLLVMYMRLREKCLEKLNGFFAFAIYDKEDETVFLARDRFGIKPLVYYSNDGEFAFGSELKALMKLGIPKVIDKVSVFTYFKLNYIPAPSSILENTNKLEPGKCITLDLKNPLLKPVVKAWYSIPFDPEEAKKLSAHDYAQSQKVLKRFVRESIRRRLVADVPVGTFLSGGIDSSIITAIAAQEKQDIEAFSIGFSDTPYFDESKYAAEIAKHLGVKHHVFDVKQNQLFEAGQSVLDHLDEPFADSSALNVYVLSQEVSKHVKVALSGDGGDELFGGYHKHGAEFKLRNPKFQEYAVGSLYNLWQTLPASRSGKLPNLVRQLQKFSDGYRLSKRDRYWRWAGIMKEEEANYLIQEQMLSREHRLSDEGHIYKKRKDLLLKNITKGGSLNEVLLTDMNMVLANDMLFKVDSMSMAHALEVRTPLLDQHIVKFAFRLPVEFKVNHTSKKKILQDSYRDLLPASVFNRPKKGFEVPLLEWFNGPMRSTFTALCSEEEFIRDQGLLNFQAVQELHSRLYSKNPGDAASTAWALVVFQHWYKKYML